MHFTQFKKAADLLAANYCTICEQAFNATFLFTPLGKLVYGESGELVCTKPFPCMPTHFWNDADGFKYKKAYFAKFSGKLVAKSLTSVLKAILN